MPAHPAPHDPTPDPQDTTHTGNVEGFAADGYAAVRRTFQRLVDDGRETGAGLSIWRAGTEVVRLNGGWADTRRHHPWTATTLVQPYSLSKAFAALTALTAVRDGTLELDRPIAAYWSGYRAHGKDHTTLRHVLTHQAGQPRFPASAAHLDLLDDAGLRTALEHAAPEHPPGASLGEHALTYGHLIDGILRAGAHTTLGEAFNDVVRPALGIDAWFGVPDHALHRVADLEYADPDWPRLLPAAPWLHTPAGALDIERINSRAWRQSVFGGVNLHATATTIAEFFSHLTDTAGPVARLLGPRLHEEYISAQATGHDTVFGTTLTWTLGFLRDRTKIAKGGIGGSVGWWSLTHGHACAYLTRRLDDHSRAAEIAAALGDDLTVQADG
ncbi:serine hydrolase domain-containing protein [Nocardiopsis sediminis]|uniref:Serine hydrolase domain-containing protein n=1 Tax=Nocardiopsis sediminis TaxID=1778267 RepID=A0ABV8FN76_9ACTN